MNDKGHQPRSESAGSVSAFVQVAAELLYSGLASDAVHLYLILLDKSWKLGCCWPSNRSIGAWMGGKSPDTVDRILKKLEARGLIIRTSVPTTEANPTGRLITVNGRVRPLRKSAEGGAAKKHPFRSANLRHDLIPQEKKKDGPPSPVPGAAPEQSIDEQIASLRELAESDTLRSIREIACRRLEELMVIKKNSGIRENTA